MPYTPTLGWFEGSMYAYVAYNGVFGYIYIVKPHVTPQGLLSCSEKGARWFPRRGSFSAIGSGAGQSAGSKDGALILRRGSRHT